MDDELTTKKAKDEGRTKVIAHQDSKKEVAEEKD